MNIEEAKDQIIQNLEPPSDLQTGKITEGEALEFATAAKLQSKKDSRGSSKDGKDSTDSGDTQASSAKSLKEKDKEAQIVQTQTSTI